MTHPFHPLCGRQFELVTFRHNWGEDRAYFHNDQGQLKTISAGWTSLEADGPFVVVSAERSALRTANLLELSKLLEELREAKHDA